MVHATLVKLIKGNRGRPEGTLRAMAMSRGFDDQTFSDTLAFVKEEPLYFQRICKPDIGRGKLAGIIAINFATSVVGLGNLIFLWRSRPQRVKAIVALALNVVAVTPLMLVTLYGYFLVLGLGIWMTVEAVRCYSESNILRYKLAEKYGGMIK
ncbi:MAG: hypothetical protein ACE5IC_04970 [Candidatus Brocadiales bacterium]